MGWLDPQNVVAVGTAVLGIAASAGMVWYERRVPRSKRIGYRVQMDNPIGEGAADNLNRRLGLFDEAPDMADATLVLLRIENDGSGGIDREDYTGPDQYGLTAVFTDRTVRGVSVTQPNHTDHLMGHFAPERGFGYEGSSLRIPRVPLNRGDYFKLLVLLSGGGVGRPIRVTGGIRNGQVRLNRAIPVDDKPPLFSRPARLISILLTAGVLTLASIVVAQGREGKPPPAYCATGTLEVAGSTAFQPALEAVADAYEEKCPDAAIELKLKGSVAGLRELAQPGADGPGIAFSDTPNPENLPDLEAEMVAMPFYALVVNNDVRVDGERLGNLTTAQIQKLYSGDVTNWRELGEGFPDLAVHLVSRDVSSGTRQVFQRRVLGRSEPAHTALDCEHLDYDRTSGDRVPRCELDSTSEVLDKVGGISGAVGYSEWNLAEKGSQGKLHAVDIDGEAPGDAYESAKNLKPYDYPYREIEYVYTRGTPREGSLALKFRNYVADGDGQDIIQGQGYIDCKNSAGNADCDAWARTPPPAPVPPAPASAR
ncbi:PstS family phosphate ABC transporter substrate-binding protein [Streptomyces sp. NPDC056161]|uniref:PstS family phosphate ABC transporter substrate-binding protein n=1 Tax=Streptomyces sp. NPDC056161 TaxID=3345732 RepID=UPI0035DD389B